MLNSEAIHYADLAINQLQMLKSCVEVSGEPEDEYAPDESDFADSVILMAYADDQ